MINYFIYGPNNAKARQTGTDGSKVYLGGYEDWITAGQTKVSLGNYAQVTNGTGGRVLNYFLTDRLGSVDAVTDGNGNLVETRGYDAFGAPRTGTWGDAMQIASTAITPKGFTSHEHLNSVQLIHMNGRMYDYQLGRFLGVDPFIQAPTNSQSMNPYSYIMNNPLAGTDPTGYQANCFVADLCNGDLIGRYKSAGRMCELTCLGGNGADKKQTSKGYLDRAKDWVSSKIDGISSGISNWYDGVVNDQRAKLSPTVSGAGSTTRREAAAEGLLDGGHMTDEKQEVFKKIHTVQVVTEVVAKEGAKQMTDPVNIASAATGGGVKILVTAAKLRKEERILAGAVKVQRVRHFSNSKGIAGIRKSNAILASDQNKVFTVKASGAAASARDTEKALGIKQGRGRNYVEFDASTDEFEVVKNPTTGATERVFKGNVDLEGRNAVYKER